MDALSDAGRSSFPRRERAVLLIVSIVAAAGLWHGWRLFWFLTDDAYIAFRYVSNSMLGHGYVWNPPPFAPVEGYTSFLWVVLLDLVWRIVGLEPPQSANILSLVFSCLTLMLGAVMVLRMDLSARLKPHRHMLLALVLLGVMTNRTFLAWTSSGLETSMFNFFLTSWVFCCIMFVPFSAAWLLGVASAAALTYLTRPDGLLFVAATAGLAALALRGRWRDGVLRWRDGFALGPLVLVPLHMAWRLSRYSEWLPNTYFAKTDPGRMWMASGVRYVASFVLEYAIWIWLVALGIALLRRRLRGMSLPCAAAATALLAHGLYYTLVTGGDHFEFRVYSHLILLLFVSFLWLLDALGARAGRAAVALCLFVLASWPIPWTHWLATRNLQTREQTYRLKVSTAETIQRALPFVPDFLLGYFRLHDRMQFWLIDRFVCMRHQEHKVFHQHLVRTLPSRDEGLRIDPADRPVLAASNVGVVGWALPHVAIIDRFGLNDRVIARNVVRGPYRFMAHERRPPDGYVECFSPNVRLADGVAIVEQRGTPLTADRIRECESHYARLLGMEPDSRSIPIFR